MVVRRVSMKNLFAEDTGLTLQRKQELASIVVGGGPQAIEAWSKLEKSIKVVEEDHTVILSIIQSAKSDWVRREAEKISSRLNDLLRESRVAEILRRRDEKFATAI